MAGRDDSSQRLSEAIQAAMEASRSRNAQMEQEAKTLYTIDIPAQKLFISDRQLADFTVSRLRDVGVRGSYRATKA